MRLAKLAGSLFLSMLLAAGLGVVAPAAAQGTQGTTNPSAVVVTTAQTAFGRVLFTSNGRALYDFTFDVWGTATTPAASNCSGACATAWPPLLAPTANGPFDADGGVQKGHLGTIKRADGTFQVTYFGQPLYGFVRDQKPGDVTGENVPAFNGPWYLVNTHGQPVAPRAVVNLELTQVGPVLSEVTPRGNRSLYNLTFDPPKTTTCVDGCARIWPPLLTTGRAMAGPGVSQDGIGSIRRPDGTRQVTYFGTPLYLFAFDLAPGVPAGATHGEYLVDPFAFGNWYLIGPSGTAMPGPVVTDSQSTAKFGSILAFNPPNGVGKNWALYAFSADTATTSACNGTCARFWQPFITSTPPTAGAGVAQGMLSAIQRADGTFQVTYNSHPLYFFSHDQAATQNGENITAFGGTFKVVSTAGNPV